MRSFSFQSGILSAAEVAGRMAARAQGATGALTRSSSLQKTNDTGNSSHSSSYHSTSSSSSFGGNGMNFSGPFGGGFGHNPFGDGSGGSGGGGGGGSGGFFNQMLEWCSQAHARDVAQRMNINLQDVKFHYMPDGQVRVQVTAPSATEEQIKQLGQRVQEECPIARFRKASQPNNQKMSMQWSALPPPSR